MSAFFTKSMARNVFYGGTLFSVLLFLALTFHTTWEAAPARSPRKSDAGGRARQTSLGNPQLRRLPHHPGRRRLLRAPELGNVYKRRGPAFIRSGFKRNRPRCRAVGRCRSSISPTSNWMTWWPS